MSDKLEEFRALSKNAKGSSAVDFINKVTSFKGFYNYAELLDEPSIKSVNIIINKLYL